VRVGKSLTQRADGRRREHDIANLPQADQQDTHRVIA
jgi:hypothetical protein